MSPPKANEPRTWGGKVQDAAKNFNISQRSFFPQGSKKVSGKTFSTVDEEVNVELTKKLKKYGVENAMRRYVRIMENEDVAAKNKAVILENGETAYTDDLGNIQYIDGDAIDEIYQNEKREEDMIDEMTRKALLSDTVAHIILGKKYSQLEAGKAEAELINALKGSHIAQVEARPMHLRCLDAKSTKYSEGITKLRTLIKMYRPILEYKSNKANDELVNSSLLANVPTGMMKQNG
jgi:hypothetical protein